MMATVQHAMTTTMTTMVKTTMMAMAQQKGDCVTD
jgi:hypothetical protein